MWEWYFSKHVLRLPHPCCFSVRVYTQSFFGPNSLPNTIVQWLSRLERHRAIWKWWVWIRDAAYVLTATSLFAQCSSTSNGLGSQPRDFPSFSVGRNREWILNTFSDHAETIAFYAILDLVKDEQTYLWAGLKKCVRAGFGSRMGGRQISYNTMVLLKTKNRHFLLWRT